MRTELSPEELKHVQLGMLKEIDAFCRENGIKYSLSCGTLLGAIRHKGFIPWDDDVDIMMPYSDMIRFKRMFRSGNIVYCDMDNVKHYSRPFSRLAHRATYNRKGWFTKGPGISIDLYPIVPLPDGRQERESFFKKAAAIQAKRKWYLKWGRRSQEYLPFFFLPGYHKVMRDYCELMLKGKESMVSKIHYLIAGPLRARDRLIYTFDPFEEMTEVDFEGHRFLSVARYDEVLTLCYGDYMEWPPEEKRVASHDFHFYWK